jgi:hypothetical protein
MFVGFSRIPNRLNGATSLASRIIDSLSEPFRIACLQLQAGNDLAKSDHGSMVGLRSAGGSFERMLTVIEGRVLGWFGTHTDIDEQKRLVDNLGDGEVMILRNHGLLACGQSIAQAFNNIYRLERACQTQLQAMACNAEISMPPPQVIARSNAQLAIAPSPDAQGRKLPHGSIEWPALKRMLDRREPSYKN